VYGGQIVDYHCDIVILAFHVDIRSIRSIRTILFHFILIILKKTGRELISVTSVGSKVTPIIGKNTKYKWFFQKNPYREQPDGVSHLFNAICDINVCGGKSFFAN